MSDTIAEVSSRILGSAIGFGASIVAASLATFGGGQENFVSLVATGFAIVFALFLIRSLVGTATISGITEYLFSEKSTYKASED